MRLLILISVAFVGILSVDSQPCGGPPQDNKDEDVRAQQVHNELRKMHNSPPLYLDENLSDLATRCAVYYAGRNRYDNSCPYKNGAGENWYSAWGLRRISGDQLAEEATRTWYREERNYDYNYPERNNNNVLTFTQVVWRSSEKMGFGYAKRNDGAYIAVALYSPAGNIRGRFRENVQRPSSHGAGGGHGQLN